VASGQWPAKRGQGSEAENLKSEIINHRSIVPNSFPTITLDTSESPLLSPLSSLPFYTSHPFVFSNLFALLVVGLGALGAWFYQIDIPHQVAQTDRQSVPSRNIAESEKFEIVGRITGMVDVKWADVNTSTERNNNVPLGRKYALSSGLMEITYDTGARVILQGPCTYQVDSRAGGYLSIGKLTARLEKKGSAKVASEERSGVRDQGSGKVASGQWSVASETNPKSQITKSQISNPQSLIPNPLSSPASVFAVRTPTATVTDLGTEFGVEVDSQGITTSYVFQGSIQMQLTAKDASIGGHSVILRKDQSSRTEKVAVSGSMRWRLTPVVSDARAFVRKIIQQPTVLDLMDIVAGGDGTGQNRERGIDPATGMQDTFFLAQDRGGDPHKYMPVTWNRLIDGVFVVDGRAGAIQLDSAGHTFEAFPVTRGTAFGSIWARSVDVIPKDERTKISKHWVYIIGPAKQYMPDNRGLLGLHPNAGITFDLAAIRRAQPGTRPTRFHAVCGAPRDYGLVDFWIFVDGQLKLNRMHVRTADGIIPVDIALSADNRFLTLVATDGGNDYHGDGFVFGDAMLHMIPAPEATEGE